MNSIAISRRKFARLLGATAASAVVRPSLLAAKTVATSVATTNIVRLSSNENPYGPAPAALRAMTEAFDVAWRYPDEQNDRLIAALAKLNGVEPEQILLGDGSGEILKMAALAFPGKLVAADPTFEAILKHAATSGSEVVKIPLAENFAHDLAKMHAAADRGLVYICNPNNPTASITPKNQLRDFISAAPREVMILVDEAYFHYADSADYESVLPVVKEHPNLFVTRTFSKIYGMAGLRCGYCVAQKDIVDRLRAQQSWDSMNCLALAAAIASIDDPHQVETGRRLNREVKMLVTAQLDSLGYNTIPSQANFIMIDLKRPAAPVIAALRQRKVQVGRLFPSLPDHLRVTIGKKSEMDSFLAAFRGVMA